MAGRVVVGLLAAVGLVAAVRWLSDEIGYRVALLSDRRHAETEAGFFRDRPYDAEAEGDGGTDADEGEGAEPE